MGYTSRGPHQVSQTRTEIIGHKLSETKQLKFEKKKSTGLMNQIIGSEFGINSMNPWMNPWIPTYVMSTIWATAGAFFLAQVSSWV